MRVKLFFSWLAMLATRSGWVTKIGITSVMLLSIWTGWYFGLQRNLAYAQSNLALELKDLSLQKNLFDQALGEYKELHAKLVALGDGSLNKSAQTINSCQLIVDQARLADLELQSYTVKKIKENFKQMIFNFTSNYQELLVFLDLLDQTGITINCQKLKITKASHRLQIAYVCGIHTFVK